MKQLRKFVSIMFLLLSVTSLQAQNLFPKKDSLGMWGYVDSVGNWAYNPTYDSVSRFSNGIAKVKIGKYYGLISPDSPITDVVYDEIILSAKSPLLARKENNYGFIDVNGNIIFPFKYYYVHYLNEDTILAKCYQKEEVISYKLINGKEYEQERITFQKVLEEHEQINKAYLKNSKKYERIIKIYEYKYSGEGNIPQKMHLATEDKKYREDRRKYYEASKAIEDYDKINVEFKQLQVCIKETEPDYPYGMIPTYNSLNQKYGYKKNGRLEINHEYDSVTIFSEGLAAVCIKEKWGYINLEGDKVIPLQYTRAGSFKGGKALVYDRTRKNIWISPKGEILSSIK